MKKFYVDSTTPIFHHWGEIKGRQFIGFCFCLEDLNDKNTVQYCNKTGYVGKEINEDEVPEIFLKYCKSTLWLLDIGRTGWIQL